MRLEPFVFQWAAAELLRSDDFVECMSVSVCGFMSCVCPPVFEFLPFDPGPLSPPGVKRDAGRTGRADERALTHAYYYNKDTKE